MNMQIAVFQKGGSIGENRTNTNTYKGRKIVKTFGQDREGAKMYAKRMRSYLTPGEKSYYKMGYTIGECPITITVD